MSVSAAPHPRIALTALGQTGLLRDFALVLGGTAWITLSAFIVLPLPFTPVPVVMSTFAVITTGAALGSLRGAMSAMLYLLIGAAGAPIFSGGQSGVLFPTFGYVLGFVLAAVVAGQLARHKSDCKIRTAVLLGTLGSLTIYACGLPWLAVSLGLDLGHAVLLGLVPFLIGDALKVVALSVLLPSAWQTVDRKRMLNDR